LKNRILTFGSLASPLARNQTQAVIDLVQARHPRLTCQLNVWDSPVSAAAHQNEPFVAASRREIEFLEQQLLRGHARLVVLEAADMVLPLPDDLTVTCVPDRAPPFDAFLNRQGLIMDEMDPGGRIGVLSMRSRSQMQAKWPDLDFVIIRGGVDRAMETHMRRTEIDGLVVPAAVTEHLGIQGIVAEIFAPEFILPGPGQGILTIVGLAQDAEARELLADLHSSDTAIELETEQAFCRRMISDQDMPVGALARVANGEVVITGATGTGSNRISVNGEIAQALAVGSGLAQQILERVDSFADLLEADFPDGLPDEVDEDATLLDEGGDLVDSATEVVEDPDELEHLRSLEDLAGIEETAGEDDPDDDLYDEDTER
jgi:hydroxymethylbilane synthase